LARGSVEAVSEEVLKIILRAGSFVDKETLRLEDLMIESIMDKRRFFVSAGSRFCIGSANAQPADIITIIAGCNFPIVLRRPVEGWYLVVGDAYGKSVSVGSVGVVLTVASG
jgi:hypothetical protein